MSSLKPISSHQVTLLKKSFRQLNREQTAARFYAKLFEKHPEVKHLFPTNMEELGAKLMSVFELVVFSFEEKNHDQYTLQESVLVPLRELGRKHDVKGVEFKYYEVANNLLIESLQEIGGEVFTKEVLDTWRLALSHLTVAMLDEKMKASSSVEKESGQTLRETFTYIKNKLLKKPD